MLFDPMEPWKKTKLKAGTYSLRPLMEQIFQNGQCRYTSPSVMDIRAYCQRELDTLWEETKRLVNPHEVYVDLSQKLYDTKIRLLEEMRETMERAAAENGASVRLESVSECTAYCTDRSHPVVKRFEDACGALGLPVRLCQTFGGSDNNHFATHGITGIVVANAMNNCHSCGEYTSEEELERAANLALRLMTAE